MIEIRKIDNSQEWDNLVAGIHGHPLQSAEWGDARAVVDKIRDHRYAVYQSGRAVYLARVEERRLLGFIKFAWLPKGPSYIDGLDLSAIQAAFLQQLKNDNYFACVTNPWKVVSGMERPGIEQTMWIDLTLGKDQLWSNLAVKCRSDIRRAIKKGVVIEAAKTREDIVSFYNLCKTISESKNFQLKTSSDLIQHLLLNKNDSQVESQLFLAKFEGQLCAGAFILRCGESAHYLWGAKDRTYAKISASEALQWHMIEWALERHCKIYDLEGIDLVNNISTYNFKKKLGGVVKTFPGKEYFPLNPFASMALACLKRFQSIKLPFKRVIAVEKCE